MKSRTIFLNIISISLLLILLNGNVVYGVTIKGTPGNDNLSGTSADDSIHSNRGNDNIVGLAGNDIVESAQGKDNVKGSEGNDTLMVVKTLICYMERLVMLLVFHADSGEYFYKSFPLVNEVSPIQHSV